MENALILETSFLIDFERERRSGKGPSLDFLAANPDRLLLITHTIAGELASGVSISSGDRWQRFIRPFRILKMTPEVDWRYGQLCLYLKNQDRLIGVNDLWIAATALVYACPVVTANDAHFRRIPDLEVLTYR